MIGPEPADEHQHDQDRLAGGAGRSAVMPVDSADGGERRDDLEQHLVEPERGRTPAGRRWTPTTAPTLSSATVSAWRWTAGGRAGGRARARWVRRGPRRGSTKPSSAKVVTLMPPAVPALPPPMNISTSLTSRVPSLHLGDVDAVEAGGAGHHRVEEPGQQLAAECRAGRACPGWTTPRRVIAASRRPRSRTRRSPTVIFVCSDQRARRAQLAAQLEQHREARARR